MKIAIIGTGIAGLGAAYLLNPQHDITVYEKNTRLGGHSRTIEVPMGGEKVPVDTGFIVFNNWNYANLTQLFQAIKVPFQKSDMSFGVSIDQGWLEYSSSGLFAQTRNWLRPAYYNMLLDILRFNRRAWACVEHNAAISLQDCLDQLQMGEWFRRYYLLAMGAAIWSCPLETIMRFPARTFLQFFKNHGLLNLRQRPQWYTVTGGSREYVKRLVESFHDKIKLGCAVTKVTPHTDQNGKISLEDTGGHTEWFDQVIFCCHADEALQIIADPTPYQTVLGAFTYQHNAIVVHSDTGFMPQRKACWASWVYLCEGREDNKQSVSLSYWMNHLQSLDRRYPVIVTLNPGRRPQQDCIFDEYRFAHPVFDHKAIQAQAQMQSLQGQGGLWFCGAYQRYGFHEDGLLSALNVVKALGVDIPWQ